VWASSSASDERSGQKIFGNSKLSGVLGRGLPNSSLHCHSRHCHAFYISDEVVDFSFVSFGRGFSQINITGLIGDVFFTFLKCFTERVTLPACMHDLHMHVDVVLTISEAAISSAINITARYGSHLSSSAIFLLRNMAL
jgi:hypothetical protein